jgi:pilus assembly protein FimV
VQSRLQQISRQVVLADASEEPAALAENSESVASTPDTLSDSSGADATTSAGQEEVMPVIEDTAPVTERPAPRYTQQVSGQYRVQENDTLWSLAEKLRPSEEVTVEQMMLAMVQENPESFIKENINGVKRGYILRMPDRNSIAAVDSKTARIQVAQHNSLWREYRQKMSGSVPASAMEADDESVRPTEPVTDGRLNIVSAAGSPGSEGAASGQDPKSQVTQLKRELSLARETLESERMEKENLSERLAELESRVQRVIQMDAAELAKLQADLAGTKKQADKLLKPAVKPAETAADLTSNIPAPVSATEKPVAQPVVPAAGEAPLFADEATAPQVDTLEPVAPDTATEIPESVAPAPLPEPAVPGTGLLDNPMILAAVAGVTVLLGALGFVFMRRRRAAAESEEMSKWSDVDQPINFDDAVESVGEPFVRNRSPDATAGMHSDDITVIKPSAAKPVMNDTLISPAEEAAAESEVRDDVLAEADVYLAYGIYQQAEDLLRNALKQHPDRDDYRMKLLETHFASKNAAAYKELAEVARQRKGSVKTYWDRVVVMGRELCPGDQLFGNDTIGLPDFDAGDLLPQKPRTTDFELDASGMAPDLDLGFTENKSVSKPAASNELDMDMDLDFSMDPDATMVIQPPVTAPKAPVSAPAISAEPEFDLAADLENIANAMGHATPASSSKKAPAPAAELDLGELDFGADALSMDSSSSSNSDSLDDDFALDFEASDLGLASDEINDFAEMDTSLDLSMDSDMDMSLDMSIEEPAAKPAAAKQSSAMRLDSASGDDDFDISQLSDDVDEVSTKLDLARAYMDMGDNEGARNILEEVKSEGNTSQKKQAEELLAKAS